MKDTSFLKAACLAGAIADLTFGLLIIVFPSVCLKIYGINVALSSEIRFWMAYAGTVIFTWTAFLIWGLIQLKERKFIALVSAFVVLGLGITQIVGIFFGAVPAVNMVPLFAMQFILMVLLLRVLESIIRRTCCYRRRVPRAFSTHRSFAPEHCVGPHNP